jgi:hypothetical protein
MKRARGIGSDGLAPGAAFLQPAGEGRKGKANDEVDHCDEQEDLRGAKNLLSKNLLDRQDRSLYCSYQKKHVFISSI